jgi:putative SOS response-associated peptidase YedK
MGFDEKRRAGQCQISKRGNHRVNFVRNFNFGAGVLCKTSSIGKLNRSVTLGLTQWRYVDIERHFCQTEAMCGRLTLTHPSEALARLFSAIMGNDLPHGANYNICPTNSVPVVTADGVRRLRAMRWGFIPSWYKSPTDGPLIINARSDTIANKPAFRDAIRTRRCILPTTGFYEWSAGPNGTRLPWYFTQADGAPLALAALWQSWGNLDTVAMVTTEAGPQMRDIHDREPVILDPSDWALWLGEAGHGAAPLMRATSGVLARHRVDIAVNSNRAAGSELILPLNNP